MAQARVLSHRRSHDAAAALAEQAVALLEPTDYLAWQAEGDEVHGIVLAAAGRTDVARAAFERAIDRFERKGVVPAVARVGGRLQQLLGG
jgi:predicted negative regulator of RcsB-dependent stress response